MTLEGIRHWVFDMDGTLTVPIHDFPAIKRELGIPRTTTFLGILLRCPLRNRRPSTPGCWSMNASWRWLRSLPRGAVELVRELSARGYQLGILTRNAQELAYITLKAIGLDDCFAVEDVLGRDEATPKPDPAGLLQLATRWSVEPEKMVMIGDYMHDLNCGRAAGAKTVLVNLKDNPWPELTDWHAVDCAELRGMLG